MASGKFLLSCAVLALVALCVRSQSGSCQTDPCSEAECPRFLNADCQIKQDDCTANFLWKGRDVTERCSIRTCDTRVCGRNRDCMEEVVPPSCPDDKPINTCRQLIRTRCQLRPFERPLTCDDIECGEEMMCRFRERPGGFPPVVRCVPAVPQDCSELECEEGFTCVQRNRGPVCVVIATTAPPITTDTPPQPVCFRDCSITGDICELVDNFPTCVKPSECLEVTADYCRQSSQVCAVVNGTASCQDATSCDQLNCDFGFECDKSTSRPTCVVRFTAESCSELNCLTLFTVCEQVTEDLAVCRPPTECTPEFNERCLELSAICGTSVLGMVTCVSPTSCNQITCTNGEQCFEIRTNDTTIAGCFPNNTAPRIGFDCDDLSCSANEGCTIQAFPSENLTIAQCFPRDLIDSIASGIALASIEKTPCELKTCPPEKSCIDFRQGERQMSSECVTLGCMNNAQCSFNESCFVRPDGFAVCAPSEALIEFGSKSCAEIERTCPEGFGCQESFLDNVIIGTFCNMAPNFGETCDDLECVGEDIGCIETKLPRRPDLSTFSQCLASFSGVIESIKSGLRAQNLIP